MITALVYSLLLWPSSSYAKVPKERSSEEQARMRKGLTLALAVVPVIVGVGTLCALPGLNVMSRVTGMALWVTWTWIVARDVARREVAANRNLTKPMPFEEN
jgi:hypothetical protein